MALAAWDGGLAAADHPHTLAGPLEEAACLEVRPGTEEARRAAAVGRFDSFDMDLDRSLGRSLDRSPEATRRGGGDGAT